LLLVLVGWFWRRARAGFRREVGGDALGALLGLRVGDLDQLEDDAEGVAEVDPAPAGENALVDDVDLAEELDPASWRARCWAPKPFWGSGLSFGAGGRVYSSSSTIESPRARLTWRSAPPGTPTAGPSPGASKTGLGSLMNSRPRTPL
jgi:hypothetical protein